MRKRWGRSEWGGGGGGGERETDRQTDIQYSNCSVYRLKYLAIFCQILQQIERHSQQIIQETVN